MSHEPCDILRVLEKDELITASGRRMVEHFVKTWKVSALEAILSTHMLSETELADAIAALQRIVRLKDVSTLSLVEESIGVLPFRRARSWQCLVVRGDDGVAHLVAADPTRSDRIIEIKQGLKFDLILSVAERSDIVRAIDELYPLSAQLPSLYGATSARHEDPA